MQANQCLDWQISCYFMGDAGQPLQFPSQQAYYVQEQGFKGKTQAGGSPSQLHSRA